MGQISHLSAPVLEQFLIQARLTRAVASLRLQDNSRLLGDLRIHSFRAGMRLELSGLHARDLVPLEGTSVTLTILLGEEVLILESTLQEPLEDEAGNTLLMLAWPTEPARLHRRRDIRVAGPDTPPLKVRVEVDGRTLDGHLVYLTEAGLTLAFQERLTLDLHASVRMLAELPDGSRFDCPGEVRHLTYQEGQDHPMRLGIAIHPGPNTDVEAMHRLVQARRMDRSHVPPR